MARSDKRTYDEKEIGALIQRATQLQEEEEGTAGTKLSLRDIQQIASELGLRTRHLESAALEMDSSGPTSKTSGILGGPFMVNVARVVDGSLDDHKWTEIVLELRNETGAQGKISELGDAKQWLHFLGEGENGINFSKTELSVRPIEDSLSIRIQKRFGGLGLWYIPVTAISLFIMLFLTNEFPNPYVGFGSIAGVLGALGLTRMAMVSRVEKEKQRLKSLGDRLQEIVSKRNPADTSVGTNETELISETQFQKIEIPFEEDEALDGVPNSIRSSGSRTHG